MKTFKLILAGLLSALITLSSYAGTQETNLSGSTVVSIKLVKTKSPKGKFRAPEKCPIDCCYCNGYFVSGIFNLGDTSENAIFDNPKHQGTKNRFYDTFLKTITYERIE